VHCHQGNNQSDLVTSAHFRILFISLWRYAATSCKISRTVCASHCQQSKTL